MNKERRPVLSPSLDRNDPKWLGLPEAKKIIGLHRATVLNRYNGLAHPTQDDLRSAMRDLGLGRTRFYALLKGWKRDRRLFDLVPHADGYGNSQDGESNSLTKEGIGPAAHPPQYDKSDVAKANRSPFSLNLKREGGVVACRFGEYLVIDHTHPDFFLKFEDSVARPEVTLIIDLFTTMVVGCDLHIGDPSPEAVKRAIRDAVERTDRLAPKAAEVVPTLLLPIDWKSHWPSLVEEIESAGARVSVRRSAKLHRGHVTKELIGGYLDTVKLLSRKPRHDFQPSKPIKTRHAILTMIEAQIVLDAAVRKRNLRFKDGSWPSRLKIDVSNLIV